MQGWIKLHRELINKPIWQNSTPEQCKVLITLLEMVNHSPMEWEWKSEKFTCEEGQCITSIDKIVLNAGKGISKQNVRGAIARFEKMEFLTNKSTKTGRLITITNWGLYQGKNKTQQTTQPTGNRQVTKSQPTGNRQVTPNKNYKNIENDKNNNKPIYADVINYLNLKTGKRLKVTNKVKDLINARLNENFTLDDFKQVIDNKVKTWQYGDMEIYLRPETLFSNKFDGYLNECPKKVEGVPEKDLGINAKSDEYFKKKLNGKVIDYDNVDY